MSHARLNQVWDIKLSFKLNLRLSNCPSDTNHANLIHRLSEGLIGSTWIRSTEAKVAKTERDNFPSSLHIKWLVKECDH